MRMSTHRSSSASNKLGNQPSSLLLPSSLYHGFSTSSAELAKHHISSSSWWWKLTNHHLVLPILILEVWLTTLCPLLVDIHQHQVGPSFCHSFSVKHQPLMLVLGVRLRICRCQRYQWSTNPEQRRGRKRLPGDWQVVSTNCAGDVSFVFWSLWIQGRRCTFGSC